MRVLVTGGAGFIGSHVVDYLIEGGHQPVIYDLVHSPHHPNGDVESAQGDLMDPAGLRTAMEGCDAVVHLAAMADVNDVTRQPAEAERANARGTLNVLEAARQAEVSRVVYASTIWVYSDVPEPEADEDTLLPPPGHLYTATKLAGELYCRSYQELFGLDYTILRFGIPYGPRARPAAVVPTLVGKALAGEPLTIAGDGGQSRRFVYVEDLADGVVRALRPTAVNRVYNLVGAEDVTIREVAETVRQAVGETQIVHVPGRNGDFRGVEVQGDRAARELGWRPSTSFTEGVGRYVAWHRDHVEPEREPSHLREQLWASVRSGIARVERASPVAVVLGMVAVLSAFFWGLHDLGAHAEDMRTVVVTSIVGLTVFTALSSPPDIVPSPAPGLARLGWLLTGVVVALLLRYDPLRLSHSDIDLLVFSTLGAGLGIVTGLAGRRLLTARLLERPSDTGG